ncbi:MAG: hypothetical protein JXQ23_12910 [Clostridia bacterium]|nr:hypothetical protein [Clostridia bacterium]
MDSRTIIKKVIDFEDTPRIGYELRSRKDGLYNDFRGAGISNLENFDYSWHKAKDMAYKFPYLETFDGFVRHDEYGNLWGKVASDPSMQGEVIEGAMEDWSQLKNYKLPDFTNTKRFKEAENAFKNNNGRYKLPGIPGFPFAIMRNIRKMDHFLMDLILERENVDILNDMVVNMLMKITDNFALAGADAIFFCEDWGTQDRLLISPSLWREVFKPSYIKLCNHAHDRGLKVFMHSCGYIYEIIDDLIEVGIDVFQFDQPTLMGMDNIAEKFTKHKKVLFSSCDIQKVLPTGDKELIQQNARDLISKFSSHGGGYICRDYGDYPTIQVSQQSVDWMHEIFINEGVFKK